LFQKLRGAFHTHIATLNVELTLRGVAVKILTLSAWQNDTMIQRNIKKNKTLVNVSSAFLTTAFVALFPQIFVAMNWLGFGFVLALSPIKLNAYNSHLYEVLAVKGS
jgi:hypothetical protein